MLSSTIEELNFDTKMVKAEQAVKRVNGQLGGMTKVVKSLGTAIAKAFDFSTAVEYMGEALTASGNLDKQLLVLRLSLGKLKSALGEAVAPIISAFLPMVQQAVYAATRLVNTVGKVTAALFGGTAQTEDMAAAQKGLAVSSGKAARSLASFDEIERLDKGSGGSGGSTAEVTLPKVQDPLTPRLQAIVDRIRNLMAKLMRLIEPLKRISLTPVAAAFDRLRQALTPITQTLFAGLEWAWYHLLVPLAQWTVEDALPAFLDVLSSALGALDATAQALKPMAVWLWEEFLKPLGVWTGEQVIAALESLSRKLQNFGNWITENAPLITGFLSGLGSLAAGWSLVNAAVSAAGVSVTGIGGNLKGLLSFLTGTFLMDWKTAWEQVSAAAADIWTGLQEKLKAPLNGIIGFLNRLLSGFTAGLNAMIRGLNTLSFTIPDWVPILGGESFGFQLATVKTPQIPYLAQGAVLPANQPFLAVVGDQRHGTNIEAPLATIQEAVAAVMGDQIDAMMAGFEALLRENRQLRSTVENIELGDSTIGQAARRYNAQLAIMRGV